MMTVANLIFTAAGSGSKYGGKIITYSIGSGGSASGGNASGNNGGNTSATFEGTTITGNGGNGAVSLAVSGNWDVPSGGGFSGGDGGSNGGNGGGPASGAGAGAGSGGAIGAVNGYANSGGSGASGAQSNNTNLSDLQTAIESAGYSWTYPGMLGSSINFNTNATGFGCGGGSVTRNISYVNGGNGLYGGGSGSFSSGTSSSNSGSGGNGAVVCKFVGATTTYVVLTSGTSYTVPSGTDSVKIWVVGAGGSGSHSGQYRVGKGGAAGGVAWKTWS